MPTFAWPLPNPNVPDGKREDWKDKAASFMQGRWNSYLFGILDIDSVGGVTSYGKSFTAFNRFGLCWPDERLVLALDGTDESMDCGGKLVKTIRRIGLGAPSGQYFIFNPECMTYGPDCWTRLTSSDPRLI